MVDSGVWLHAVTRGLDPGQLAGVTGVGGGAVHAIDSAGLVAVVSAVDLNTFGEEPLRRNLEDLAWLEEVARAHHDVVEVVSRSGPVVPARLATVYRDDARVRAMLAERRADFAAVLDRVAGRTEWGVKMYAISSGPAPPEPAEATQTPAASNASNASKASPGTAYLRRRRDELRASRQTLDAAIGAAEEVHAALGKNAEAVTRHTPQDRRLTGQAAPMVVNGAYLVDSGRSRAFRDAVAAQANRHPAIRLELTGPWPPYSFATLEDEEQ